MKRASVKSRNVNILRSIRTLFTILDPKNHQKVGLHIYLFYTFKSLLNDKGFFIDHKFHLLNYKGTQIMLNSYMCTDINTFFEIFRLGEYDNLLSIIKNKSITKFNVIDLGANIGTFPKLLEIHKINIDQYIAVEPLHANIRALQFNTNFSNTEIIEKAVWSHNRGVKFSVNKPSNANVISNKGKLILPSITVPDLISKITSNDPLILKIDIEGFEYDLLKNNRELINLKVSFLAAEFHNVDKLNISEKKIYNILNNFDLTFTYKENGLLVVTGKNTLLHKD